MKTGKFFALILCGLLLLSACRPGNMNIGIRNKIKASDNIVKREYKFEAFDKIDISAVAHVRFVQSDKQDEFRAVMTAPDNYLELFKFENNGGQLEIKFAKRSVNIENHKVSIVVYAPSLSLLNNSGVAEVEIGKLCSQNLGVDNSGVGNIKIQDLEVGALNVECSGVGNITLAGKADAAKLECTGVGNIKAADLKARSVEAGVSGVGSVECNASENISGEVSGVGALRYGGKPASKELHRSGIGKISEL